MSKKIGIIVGSLRKESFSKKLALNMLELFPSGYEAVMVDISNLPLYNQDFDFADTPASYKPFRDTISSLDGVLFVTPEHNRSIPAALKNALDVASRPWGENVWAGKPAAIVSNSIGVLAGFGANHHLRQPLTFLNMSTVQQPEAYIGNVESLLDEQGKINNSGTVAVLQSVVDALVKMVG